MTEWLPTAIVFAIATASLAVVLMGAFVGILSLVGYDRIKKEAVLSATKAAEDKLKTYMESDEFKKLIKNKALDMSVKDLIANLLYGESEKKEDKND